MDPRDPRDWDYADLNDHLRCPICKHALVDPVQTRCGHVFCRSCIVTAVGLQHACPFDRLALDEDALQPAPRILHDMLNELRVVCPNRALGCALVVERYLLPHHLQQCSYAEGAREGTGEEAREVAGDQKLTRVQRAEEKETVAETAMENDEAETDDCPGSVYGCREKSHHTPVCPWAVLRQQTARTAALEATQSALVAEVARLQPVPACTTLDGDYYQLYAEQEHLRAGLHGLSTSLAALETVESKKSMAVMGETFRIKEELQALRSAINGIRMQIHWLVMERKNRSAPSHPVNLSRRMSDSKELKL